MSVYSLANVPCYLLLASFAKLSLAAWDNLRSGPPKLQLRYSDNTIPYATGQKPPNLKVFTTRVEKLREFWNSQEFEGHSQSICWVPILPVNAKFWEILLLQEGYLLPYISVDQPQITGIRFWDSENCRDRKEPLDYVVLADTNELPAEANALSDADHNRIPVARNLPYRFQRGGYDAKTVETRWDLTVAGDPLQNVKSIEVIFGENRNLGARFTGWSEGEYFEGANLDAAWKYLQQKIVLLVQAPTASGGTEEQRMEYNLDWIRDQYHGHHRRHFDFCLDDIVRDDTIKEIGELGYKQKMEQALPNYDPMKYKYIISEISLHDDNQCLGVPLRTLTRDEGVYNENFGERRWNLGLAGLKGVRSIRLLWTNMIEEDVDNLSLFEEEQAEMELEDYNDIPTPSTGGTTNPNYDPSTPGNPENRMDLSAAETIENDELDVPWDEVYWNDPESGVTRPDTLKKQKNDES